jgi:hypothetical protein
MGPVSPSPAWVRSAGGGDGDDIIGTRKKKKKKKNRRYAGPIGHPLETNEKKSPMM